MTAVPGVVLVVEDDERSRRLVRDVLEAHGHTVLEAATGVDAIDAATAGRPDVVLLDVQLPDMDGAAVVRALRRQGATRAVPIVAVTAFAMKGDRERFLAQGFDDHLPKPVDIRLLAELVARYVLEGGAPEERVADP